MEILFYSGICLGVVILSEVGAYCWHRWGSHTNIIPIISVKKTHDIHHTIIDDKAEGDFFYILILLILYFNLLLLLYMYLYINTIVFLILYIPVLSIFIYNYYIHSAYHEENHWLNEYEWFRNDKRIHFQHHEDPTKNFGIATHYTDIILDTFDYGFPILSVD